MRSQIARTQVRGPNKDDGNATRVGKWLEVPGIAAVLK